MILNSIHRNRSRYIWDINIISIPLLAIILLVVYILIFIEKKMLISQGSFATLNIIQYNFPPFLSRLFFSNSLLSPGLSWCSAGGVVGSPPRHDDRPGQCRHPPGCGHRDVPLSPLSSLRRQEREEGRETSGEIAVLLSYYFSTIFYKYKEKGCKILRSDFFCWLRVYSFFLSPRKPWELSC